jgi:predicted metallopeptidase
MLTAANIILSKRALFFMVYGLLSYSLEVFSELFQHLADAERVKVSKAEETLATGCYSQVSRV